MRKLGYCCNCCNEPAITNFSLTNVTGLCVLSKKDGMCGSFQCLGKFLLKKSALSSVLWNSTCQLGNNGTFLPWPSCPKPYTFNHLAVDFVVLAQVCDQRVRSIDSIDSIDVSCFTYVSCLFHFDGKMHLASLRPGQGRVSSLHLNLSPWAESLDPSSPVELGQVLEVHSCTWHLRTPHYSSLQAMLPCQVNNTMSSSDSQAVKSMGLKNDASVIGETYQTYQSMGDPNAIAVKPGFPISTTAVKPSNRQTQIHTSQNDPYCLHASQRCAKAMNHSRQSHTASRCFQPSTGSFGQHRPHFVSKKDKCFGIFVANTVCNPERMTQGLQFSGSIVEVRLDGM